MQSEDNYTQLLRNETQQQQHKKNVFSLRFEIRHHPTKLQNPSVKITQSEADTSGLEEHQKKSLHCTVEFHMVECISN